MSEELKVSMRGFAKIIDISETMIRRYIQKDRITKNSLDLSNPKRPLVYVERAKKDLKDTETWAYNSEPEKRAKHKHNKEERMQSASAILPPANPLIVSENSNDYQAMTLGELAKMKEVRNIQLSDIKIGEAAKTLVSKTAVYDALFRTGQEIRNAFLFVPDRIVDDLLLAKDRDEMHNILSKEIHSVLTGLANAGRNLPV